MRDSVPHPTHATERITQIVVRFHISRLNLERSFILRNGGVDLAFFVENQTEIRPGDKIIRRLVEDMAPESFAIMPVSGLGLGADRKRDNQKQRGSRCYLATIAPPTQQFRHPPDRQKVEPDV